MSDQEENAPATFTHTLKDGAVAVVGKPGILKLRLREIVPDDMIKDPEIITMASAFLSIKTLNGTPFRLRTPNEMAAFTERFRDEEDLNNFIDKWTALTNPALAAVIQEALNEADELQLSPEGYKEHIQKRVMEHERKHRKQVQD